MLRLRIGPLTLHAELEAERAPRTVAGVRRLLPLRATLLQGRWSGEAAWVPLGDLKVDGLGYENHNSYPAPGELLFYCFGVSEAEIYLPYGANAFASRYGLLAGNHFATVTDGRDALREVGRLVHWQGAQEIVVDEE